MGYTQKLSFDVASCGPSTANGGAEAPKSVGLRLTSMIRIGPAGWSYKDWQGVVKPVSKPKGFQELTYISGFFDTVEINVTFYRPIPGRTSERWLKKVEKNTRFKFTGKLWQGFTQDRNAGGGW